MENADRMIWNALKQVVELGDGDMESISYQVSNWSNDVLKIRIFDATRDINSLSLNAAAEIIYKVKLFFGYSAHNQIDPKPFFERAGGTAGEFTSKCRFGHTFEGSFGLRVECPFEYDSPLLPMEDNPPDLPFERQVMERIAVGLNHLRAASTEDRLDPLITGYDQGFNANTLRVLAETYERLDGARMEFDLIWGGQLPSDQENEWTPYVFEGRSFELSRRAAEELERVVDEPERIVEGHVTLLRSDQPPGEDEQFQFEHLITMYWERERNLRVKIRVPLTPVNYKAACDAHRDGRKVRIHGFPRKQGKSWTLTRGRDFTIL